MGNVTVKLKRSGVRSLLRSQEMMDICTGYANDALARLGDGYGVDAYVGKNRVNVSLRTVTAEAVRENAQTNSLLKALGGGSR